MSQTDAIAFPAHMNRPVSPRGTLVDIGWVVMIPGKEQLLEMQTKRTCIAMMLLMKNQEVTSHQWKITYS